MDAFKLHLRDSGNGDRSTRIGQRRVIVEPRDEARHSRRNGIGLMQAPSPRVVGLSEPAIMDGAGGRNRTDTPCGTGF